MAAAPPLPDKPAARQNAPDRLLADLARCTPHPVLISDPAGAVVYCNPAAERWLERIDTHNPLDLLPPHHRELVTETLTRGEPREVEETVERHALLWTYAPGPERVYLSARDVTEQRRTESQLRISEARHRLLAEQSTDLISRHTPGDWKFLYASPAATTLLGYAPRELVGRSSKEFFHPEDARTYKQRSPSVVYEQGYYTNTYRFRRRDGEYTWLETTSRTLRDPVSGEPLEILCVSRDVSRRIQMEEQQRQHQTEVAHAARLITLGEMASMLAHELNQPLAAIVNYARGSVRRLEAEASRETIRDGLTRIAQQADRAGEIIKRLRGFVRKGEFQRAPLDIRELIEEMVQFSRPEARRTRVEVEVRPDGRLPRVLGDKVQIEQVILNLLRNAVEACHHQERRRVTLDARQRPDHQVEVRVSDSGHGLPPGDPEQLFEQFYTTKPKGLGLGLGISRSIIEAHGGQLWAENLPGGGARFAFTLPIAQEKGR